MGRSETRRLANKKDRRYLATWLSEMWGANMSKQIGPREAALRAMREAEKPAKATVPALPRTTGVKPVKRKAKKR
jgi:hypothetical protein